MHLTILGLYLRIQFVERNGTTVLLHHAAVKTLEAPGLRYTTGVRDDADFLAHGLGISSHSLGFVFGH
jgi:hypothetical protein